jgi:hypothetical protein
VWPYFVSSFIHESKSKTGRLSPTTPKLSFITIWTTYREIGRKEAALILSLNYLIKIDPDPDLVSALKPACKNTRVSLWGQQKSTRTQTCHRL